MGRRALWRGPWSIVEVAAKQVFSRGSMILPAHVGRTYEVHNGKSFIPVKISEDMVGHKFGEFSHMKKKVVHAKKAS